MDNNMIREIKYNVGDTAFIVKDAELTLNRNALQDVEEALLALKARVESQNPALFETMAESYYKDITRIRDEIDEYLGLERIDI